MTVAAALGPSTAPALARAWGGDSVVPIQAAIAGGFLVVGDDLVLRFSHPLLASAALAELDPLDRQALHARLVDVVDDPDQRARHLALSCAEPDAAVADELGQAAMRASRRGASALAAELADHCLRVTPPADLALRARRWLVAILHRATAGEKARALAELDELIGLLPSGPIARRGDWVAGGDRLRFRRSVPRAGTRRDRRRRTAARSDPRAVRLGRRHPPRRAASRDWSSPSRRWRSPAAAATRDWR